MSLTSLYTGVTRYREVLERLEQETNQGPRKYKQLALMSDAGRIRLATSVLQQGSGILTLIHPPQSAEEESEEYLMYIQGYLVQKRLPPIVQQDQLGLRPQIASQSVTLSGLGSEEFNKAVLAIDLIHQRFEEYCTRHQLQPTNIRRERGFPILTFGNRYLSAPDDDGSQEILTITDEIDPLRILRNVSQTMFYTTDNQVHYYERSLSKETAKPVYNAVPPASIHIGHLVEVQMAFCTVPVKQGKLHLISKLRSICILDRTLEHDGNMEVLRNLAQSTDGPRRPLKRKIGYQEDEDVHMGRQLQKLTLDKPTN